MKTLIKKQALKKFLDRSPLTGQVQTRLEIMYVKQTRIKIYLNSRTSQHKQSNTTAETSAFKSKTNPTPDFRKLAIQLHKILKTNSRNQATKHQRRTRWLNLRINNNDIVSFLKLKHSDEFRENQPPNGNT